MSEQDKICSHLDLIDKHIAELSTNFQKLHHQKTGLMQDLLTGKVRVTNLLKEKEPTSP